MQCIFSVRFFFFFSIFVTRFHAFQLHFVLTLSILFYYQSIKYIYFGYLRWEAFDDRWRLSRNWTDKKSMEIHDLENAWNQKICENGERSRRSTLKFWYIHVTWKNHHFPNGFLLRLMLKVVRTVRIWYILWIYDYSSFQALFNLGWIFSLLNFSDPHPHAHIAFFPYHVLWLRLSYFSSEFHLMLRHFYHYFPRQHHHFAVSLFPIFESRNKSNIIFCGILYRFQRIVVLCALNVHTFSSCNLIYCNASQFGDGAEKWRTKNENVFCGSS